MHQRVISIVTNYLIHNVAKYLKQQKQKQYCWNQWMNASQHIMGVASISKLEEINKP